MKTERIDWSWIVLCLAALIVSIGTAPGTRVSTGATSREAVRIQPTTVPAASVESVR